MANITTSRINFSAITPSQYPPVGRFIIGLDTDDIYKKMDSNGVITIIGSGADTNTFLTGGTYNNPTGTATYTNNLGNTFNVSGFYTGGTDDNTFVTGGTYNDVTGTATFTNNLNGNFDVDGFFTGSTGFGITDITYADLKSTYDASGMTVGYYRITDFATIYTRPDFHGPATTGATGSPKAAYDLETVTAATEPIIVFASSESVLDENAYQEAYPGDRIKYDINWTKTSVVSADTKGRIIERIDSSNNRTDYDHRTVLFKRYREDVPYSTRYTVINDNGEAFNLYPTFNDLLGLNREIYMETSYDLIPLFIGPEYPILTNNVFTGGLGYINVRLGYLTGNNTYWDSTNSSAIANVNMGVASQGNVFNDSDIFDCDLGDEFSNNIIEASVGSFAVNTFGSSCSGNIFSGGSVTNNVILSSFDNNNLEGFERNNVGANFNNNTIGDQCNDNVFGNNTINNTIGANFHFNTLSPDSSSGVDYTSATHVYGNYDCEIVRRQDGASRLKYMNNSDVVTVVLPTA